MLSLLEFAVAIVALKHGLRLVRTDHPWPERRGPSGPSALCCSRPRQWRSRPCRLAHHAVRGDARRRPVLELHAERKAALGEDFLDLGERLLAEVRRLEQLDF